MKQEISIRNKIYTAIKQFPGIHFRELQRKVGTGTGNLEHHVAYLEKHDLIQSEVIKGKKHFFFLGLNERERMLLSLLRQRILRTLCIVILENGKITHKEALVILKRSPSVVSWYLHKLQENRLARVVKRGREREYFLIDRKEIARLLIAHKESFLDQIVDNFVELWEH